LRVIANCGELERVLERRKRKRRRRKRRRRKRRRRWWWEEEGDECIQKAQTFTANE